MTKKENSIFVLITIMVSNIKHLFQKMAVFFLLFIFCPFIENVFGLCVYNRCLKFLRKKWFKADGAVNKEQTLETKCHVNSIDRSLSFFFFI